MMRQQAIISLPHMDRQSRYLFKAFCVPETASGNMPLISTGSGEKFEE